MDFQFDYYNGLKFHFDRIYWLEEKCNKLQSSNKYYRNLANNKHASASQDKSSKLQKLLNETKDKLKAQEIVNVQIDQERSELREALTQQRLTCSQYPP